MKTGLGLYVLGPDHQPVSVDSFEEWVRDWAKERIVKQTAVGDMEISTIFLGVDHGWGLTDKPVLFETMIFGGRMDGWQLRYATWDQAIAGHDMYVAQARAIRRGPASKFDWDAPKTEWQSNGQYMMPPVRKTKKGEG